MPALGIQAAAVEPLIQCAQVANHEGLKPTLRMQPPERLMAGAVRTASGVQAAHEVCEVRL